MSKKKGLKFFLKKRKSSDRKKNLKHLQIHILSYLSKHFDLVPVTFLQDSCHSPHLQMRSSRLRKVKQSAQGLVASVSGSLEPGLLLPNVRFLKEKQKLPQKLEHRGIRSLQHLFRFPRGESACESGVKYVFLYVGRNNVPSTTLKGHWLIL